MEKTKSYTYKQRKQLTKDRQRPFRIIEFFDFPGIISGSPVEVIDGFVISDKTTNELFFTFSFKNVSSKKINSLEIRIHLFDTANIPYEKLPFVYSYSQRTLGVRTKNINDNKNMLYTIKKESKYIDNNEKFGTYSYIKIPEAYFKKIKLELFSVTYADGTVEELEIIISNNYKMLNELDDDSLFTFSCINIYGKTEQSYPAVVIPQKSNNAWLCCCGQKNISEFIACEKCLREKDWQFNNLSEDKLKETTEKLKRESVIKSTVKANYSQTKYLETKEEKERKVKEYEKAMENIAERERKSERLKLTLLPRLAFIMFLITFLVSVLTYIYQNFIK